MAFDNWKAKRKLDKLHREAEALRYRTDRQQEYRERRKTYLLEQAHLAEQMGQAKQLEAKA